VVKSFVKEVEVISGGMEEALLSHPNKKLLVFFG
jgi:hypothetical protein